MKITITRMLDVPMVFRIAMSRLFCLTRRMSDEMMLSAPTITMRPIVIEIAIFSSQSAEKSDRLSSDQSSADVFGTETRRGIDRAMSAAAQMSFDAQLNEIRRVLREQLLGEFEVHETERRVVLVEPELKDSGDTNPPVARHEAHR